MRVSRHELLSDTGLYTLNAVYRLFLSSRAHSFNGLFLISIFWYGTPGTNTEVFDRSNSCACLVSPTVTDLKSQLSSSRPDFRQSLIWLAVNVEEAYPEFVNSLSTLLQRTRRLLPRIVPHLTSAFIGALNHINEPFPGLPVPMLPWRC